MRLDSLIQTLHDLTVDNQLEEALRQLLSYLQENQIEADRPLVKDVYQLLGQLKSLEAKSRVNTISQADYTLELNRIRAGLLNLIEGIRKFKDEKDFLANASGKGKLLHNIPSRMTVQQPTTCTVRIGAAWENIIKNFVPTEYTKLVDDIDVTEIMNVELLSRDSTAFDIWTPNNLDQKAKLSAFTEWVFEVTPKKVGKFPLYLKVSTVDKVDNERVYYNMVYNFAVDITTDYGPVQEQAVEWQALLAQLEAEKKKKPLLAWGGMGKLMALAAGLAVVVVAAVGIWQILGPSSENLTDATFRMTRRLQAPEILLNGISPAEWSFTADSMGIIIPDLTVDSSYNLSVSDSTWHCGGTFKIMRPSTTTYTLSCSKTKFELGIMTRSAIGTLSVDNQPYNISSQSPKGNYSIAKLTLPEGQHRIEARLSDGSDICIPADFYLSKDTTISMRCLRNETPPSSGGSTSTNGKYSVTLLVSTDFYEANKRSPVLFMDGQPQAINPTVTPDGVEYVLPGIGSGSYRFEMDDQTGYFDCKPTTGKVEDYNNTFYLDCPWRKAELHIMTTGVLRSYVQDDILEVLVNGVKRKAKWDQATDGFVLKGVQYGPRPLEFIVPEYCACTNPIQTVVIKSPVVQVGLDCNCDNGLK